MLSRFRSFGCLLLVGACFFGTLRSGTAWDGDPLVFQFAENGVRCALPKGNGMAVYTEAPRASTTTIEACFTPELAGGVEWSLAAVAIVQDERHFWHLALVQAPPEKGSRRMIELVEMREGRWHAQQNLRGTVREAARETWEPGRTYRLRLSLRADGIEGEVQTAKGRTLLRQHYAFNGPAVTSGRPALRVAGITGTFTEVKAAWSQTPPVSSERQNVRDTLANRRGATTDETGNDADGRSPIPAYAADMPATSAAKHRPTGFFRVVQDSEGRWWTIDPLGREVVLLGVDHVTYQGHWCETLGYAPHGRKNERRHPERGTWEAETLARLRAWGFNLLGAGSDPKLRHRGLIHTEFLNLGAHLATLGDEYDITPDERRPCTAFPNVFHPAFEASCRHRARRAAEANRNDPWLFGTFLDNELAWWGRGELETGLFDAALRKHPGHTAHAALRRLVESRCGGDIAAANALFGTRCASFDELLSRGTLPHATPEQRALKRAFLELAAERYFSVATAAVRAADPNHLVLGARFAGTEGAAPIVWEIAGKYCDVVTFNSYPMADLDRGAVYTHLGDKGEPVTTHYAKFYALARRPMLITEWSFPALDAGLPSLHGAGQRFSTQAERTEATRLYARTVLSQPYLLGYDYFMWVDEPALGISAAFPEDSNYGLINEDGVPYEALTGMFAALHREALVWRRTPPPAPKEAPGAATLPGALEIARRAGGRAAAAGAAPARFVRDGGQFSLTNGNVALTGGLGPGPMVRRVAFADERAEAPQKYTAGQNDAAASRVLGRYNAMLHTRDEGGAQRWSETREVIAVAGREERGLAIAEIDATGRTDRTTYAVRHRLALPAGASWWTAECIQITNTGGEPLRLRALYFRPDAEFRDLPAKLPPNLWGMPEAGAWLHADDGRFYGAVASRRSAARIHFWVDGPARSPHPDARIELEETLVAPGATFRPEAPAHVLCVVGRGGERAWLETARELKATLE